MQASSIEAREKFLGAWSNVSRLEVLGGAEVFLDGMNRWQIRRTQELFVEVDVPHAFEWQLSLESGLERI
jgi:hypothetical protein